MRARRALLLVAVLSTGCQGITIEIVEPGLPDGTTGAPGVVGWEVRVETVDGLDCPHPAAQRFDGDALWLRAGDGVVPVASTDLEPGRYVVSAIGRDAGCVPLYYGQTCFGPEAPPRVVMVTTCAVTDAVCADLAWTSDDRDALACTASCSVGRCE